MYEKIEIVLVLWKIERFLTFIMQRKDDTDERWLAPNNEMQLN